MTIDERNAMKGSEGKAEFEVLSKINNLLASPKAVVSAAVTEKVMDEFDGNGRAEAFCAKKYAEKMLKKYGASTLETNVTLYQTTNDAGAIYILARSEKVANAIAFKTLNAMGDEYAVQEKNGLVEEVGSGDISVEFAKAIAGYIAKSKVINKDGSINLNKGTKVIGDVNKKSNDQIAYKSIQDLMGAGSHLERAGADGEKRVYHSPEFERRIKQYNTAKNTLKYDIEKAIGKIVGDSEKAIINDINKQTIEATIKAIKNDSICGKANKVVSQLSAKAAKTNEDRANLAKAKQVITEASEKVFKLAQAKKECIDQMNEALAGAPRKMYAKGEFSELINRVAKVNNFALTGNFSDPVIDMDEVMDNMNSVNDNVDDIIGKLYGSDNIPMGDVCPECESDPCICEDEE